MTLASQQAKDEGPQTPPRNIYLTLSAPVKIRAGLGAFWLNG